MKNFKEVMALVDLKKKGVNVTQMAKKYFKDMKEILKEASDLYYNTDERLMSDEDYDILYKIYNEGTGDRIVGSPARKNVVGVDHSYKDLGGTLGKAHQLKEVEDFLKKTHKTGEKLELGVSLKFDGNSGIEEKDNKGKTKLALTRGEDGQGKDITEVVKNMKNIDIDFDKECGIKYEYIMTYKDLDNYSKLMSKEYKNPRNTVAGIFSRDDGKLYAGFVTAVPLWIRIKDEKITRKEEIELLGKLFKDNINSENYWVIEANNVDEAMNDIKEIYNIVLGKRENLEFMIDGLVIEILDQDKRDTLGFVNDKQDEPKWAIALKFPYMEHSSEVERIEFSLSDKGTGIITPMCYFKPVYFNNCEQTKQSLQNYKRFKELNLGVGSPINVKYSGDVLTYIEALVDPNPNRKPIPFIDHCPLCKGDVEIVVNDKQEETFVKCANPNCPSKRKGRILNYCIKMKMKGIGASVIDKLVDNNVLSNIKDLYDPELENKSGSIIGKKTANNTVKAINSRLSVFDYEFIGSLGIENFGRTMAKEVFKIMTFDEFIDLYNDNQLSNKLVEINGIGDKLSKYVIDKIKYMEDEISDLIEILNIKNFKDTLVQVDKVLNIAVTGKLEHFKRDEIGEVIESKGHKFAKSVSKKTDYLVNNDTQSTSGKNSKAKELNIPIITEEELIKLLNL